MENQTAVVTGGAQGIGLAVVEQLIDKGVRVASWDFDATNKQSMSKYGDRALAVSCDITDRSSVEAAYQQTSSALGIPHILVNSAGIAGPNTTLDEYDIDEWNKVIDVNLNGTFLVNRVCVPGMKKQGYGRCLLYTSPSPRDATLSRMPSSA